jgi:hypothetical protein
VNLDCAGTDETSLREIKAPLPARRSQTGTELKGAGMQKRLAADDGLSFDLDFPTGVE